MRSELLDNDELPYPATGPSRRTMAFLRSVDPDIRVLDGGPGNVKDLDREWYDAYVKRYGAQALRAMGLNVMEADWVASDIGLLYVNPKLGNVRQWPWESASFEVAKRGRRFCRLWVMDNDVGERHLLQLGIRAMDNLVAAAALLREALTQPQRASSERPIEPEAGPPSQQRNSEYRTSDALKRAAVEDPVATQLAQTAMKSWHQDFEDLIRHAAEKSAPPAVDTVFIEAYATVRAMKQVVDAGEVPGNTEGVYNELRIVGQNQAANGMSKEWVVARWMLRQVAALLALRMYLGETADYERVSREWNAAQAKLGIS